jgi:uncharacterized protein YndB with AHSA1/START domain
LRTVTNRSTTTIALIKASPVRVYQAFVEEEALLAWLPPGEMTGRFHEFDARVGGGYVMSLFYPESETEHQGKTAEREDKVRVRFVELVPPSRIVEAVTFDSDDQAFAGEMKVAAVIQPAPAGPDEILRLDFLWLCIRPENNELGGGKALKRFQKKCLPAQRSPGRLAPGLCNTARRATPGDMTK